MGKRSWLLVTLGVPLLLLAILATYPFRHRSVPAGQPPLAEITPRSLGELRGRFNESADSLRALALLSPT